jgi:hypothetical protein
MSQENVESVRRGYEQFNRTGEPDYSVLDPEIVYDVSRRTFDPTVYRGHKGCGSSRLSSGNRGRPCDSNPRSSSTGETMWSFRFVSSASARRAERRRRPNVEVIWRSFDAIARGDVDSLLGLHDCDAE